MIGFLETFLIKDGILSMAVGNVRNVSYHTELPGNIPPDKDVFFGPAMRKVAGDKKEAVLGTTMLWVDVDSDKKPLYTYPPSMVVNSGHGYHLYWKLSKPLLDVDEIERLNKILAKDVPNGDDCHNANRFMRVPGTTNTKEQAVPVELVKTSPVTYNVEDFNVLGKLHRKVKHKIRTGDRRGYRSRSERDWAIIIGLLGAGASDTLIHKLFSYQPCGDKFRESNEHYLPRTLESARKSKALTAEKADQAGPQFLTHNDGYYFESKRGSARVSTFTIDPMLLLDGQEYNAEDAIVGNVQASEFVWPNVTFPRSAFTSVRRMDSSTPFVAWQWLGTDQHVRLLLPHLLEQLKEKGLPRVVATAATGLHWLKDTPYFVGNNEVLSSDDIWKEFSGPIAWLPSKKEHPIIQLIPRVSKKELTLVGKLVPRLNEPETIWPALGWYAAAPLKPWFEREGVRFPILSVAGTKGSGKTTLIQRAMMPLFGQKEGKSYDAGTTRFVVLALLGGTNAVPIAFSEFRYDSVERFIRFVLLSYDTGHDPRGRADQTTVDYPLSAPFSLDGEDLIADPAARERVVVAHLDPRVVAEKSEAYNAYNEFRWSIPEGFGGGYIQHCLGRLVKGELNTVLKDTREALFSTFPQSMPDRVRSNHVVAMVGVRLFCQYTGIPEPDASVMSRSIGSIYNLSAGRARTLVDDMVEDVANACSQTTRAFQWHYSRETSTLWFQLSSTHNWWVGSRIRTKRSALERDAIRSQLKESPYYLAPKAIDGVFMYGVDLKKAQDAGLDVPEYLDVNQITLRF